MVSVGGHHDLQTFANDVSSRVGQLENNAPKTYATKDELESMTSGLRTQVSEMMETIQALQANVKGQRDDAHYDSEGHQDEETTKEKES